MKRPLVSLALIFACGIILARAANFSFFIFYALAAASAFLGVFFFRRASFSSWATGLAVLFFGAALLASSQFTPRCHISNFIRYQNNNFFAARGRIIDQPRAIAGQTVFLFRANRIHSDNFRAKCCGDILVCSGNSGGGFSYGQELILKGKIRKPRFRRDSRFIMQVRSPGHIARLGRNKGFFIKRFALSLKKRAQRRILKYSSEASYAIIGAMVFGDKSAVPPKIYHAMVKTGIVHILVVSGFNLGIVAFMLILFMKVIRVGPKWRIGLGLPCLIIYCLATGASTPVVRATIMSIVFMCSYLFRREADIYNSCAASALFILMADSRQLFDIGFQLSFASVIAIISIYPRLRLLINRDVIKNKALIMLADGLLISLSAWLGTAPLIIYYFGLFSPVAVLANIFIVPLAALITLCGFSLILVSAILPCLAPYYAQTIELAVMLLIKADFFLLKLPYSHFTLRYYRA